MKNKQIFYVVFLVILLCLLCILPISADTTTPPGTEYIILRYPFITPTSKTISGYLGYALAGTGEWNYTVYGSLSGDEGGIHFVTDNSSTTFECLFGGDWLSYSDDQTYNLRFYPATSNYPGYLDAWDAGYSIGYTEGQQEGMTDAIDAMDLTVDFIPEILKAPFQLLYTVLDITVFGIHLYSVVIGIAGLAMIFAVIAYIKKLV